ncbi:homoserine O-acetyltransferase [Salinisphaera sp. C84B14]|uniref:alpha/beta fold hydrolase n=1 Tax=Salinisphaera sp. C84B14 TaxID=1304155 RepID=UPI00333E69B4
MQLEQWHEDSFPVGDFVLDSGTVLRDARLAYHSRGTLNSAADNLVVLPTHYGGAMQANHRWADSPDSPLAGTDYCILVPALFGNGESSSPSNAGPGQGDSAFPQVTLADNVRAQRRLIEAQFDDACPRLVAGWSMGGMQALQWGALYPQRVGAVLAICATARCYPHNALFLDGIKAALEADPALAAGGFPERGLRAFARVYAGWAYSQRFFRDGGYRGLGFDSVADLVAHWEADHLRAHPYDLLAMLDTWQQGDIARMPGFAGDTTAALERISAPTIAMPCATDLYFTAEDAAADVAQIAAGTCRVLASDYGHCAGGPGYEAPSMQAIFAAMRTLLEPGA